ncbi:uncharacterized protein F4807DRAFT_442512 [Annulohypoxylon truncatum]|uniref:uncharacterized protein n=1 Tax=Annulohypoxylon truncatum TaxID=327061 RepID=UPI0020088254|nr:uncharacterized protein F4807DRAFT_442512 [Annulohypoxylon truncatum]KAI1205624.1 hypothetical protein F4807DRAFT_442512 [Annulohypoxylon truncatum]
MFRLLRSRPNPLTLATRVHGSTGPMPQVMQVQRVRIRRKWFKPKNFILAGCIYYICYQAYEASIFMTLSAWLEEQEKHLTRKEREEMEEEMLEPMFFPIPFTTRPVESPPYRGSDPEWQTFIRINGDRELTRSIQDDLAELVRKTALRSIVLVQRCGKDMSLSRYWLHIIYPSRPPPTFVQKGISIGDEVAITEKPIDTTAAIWIRRALWPYPITVSLWSFTGALMKQNVSHVAKIFGYDPNPDSNPSLQKTIKDVEQRLKNTVAEADSKASKTPPSTKPQEAGGSSGDSPSPIENRPAGSSPTPESSAASPSSGVSRPIPVISGVESNKPKSVKDIYGIESTQEHMKGPWMAFKQKFGQTWRPIQGLPPRGSIFISGLVEIATPRAYITVDAKAFWDPKTKTFDTKTMTFRLRTIRMKTQSPARY